MKLEKLNIYHVRIPLVSHFETSFGRVDHQDTVIVESFVDGAVGYGESPAGAAPLYCSEDVYTCMSAISRHIFPLVNGTDFGSIPEFSAAMKRIRGNNIAKAGVETSLCDAFAKKKGRSLTSVLADELGMGPAKKEVQGGISLGVQDCIEELLQKISAARARGYKRIKAKIKPGWDYAVLEAVRKSFPSIELWADANAAYSLKDLDLLKSFRLFNLGLIEQPFDHNDILDHALLQSKISFPVCLDESIITPVSARQALECDACRIINVKVSRMGGHFQSTETGRIAKAENVPLWVGGMLETGIGRAHNVALASLAPFILPNDISETSRYYAEDIALPHFRLNEDGTVSVPTGPGIGVNVQKELLDKFTIEKIQLS